MAYADRAGMARVDPRAPSAFGVCDGCGRWFNRVNLIAERQWLGPQIKPTGFLVCQDCLDVPQEQLRPVILPVPDPKPVVQPRPEPHQSIPDLAFVDGDNGAPILDSLGNPIVNDGGE